METFYVEKLLVPIEKHFFPQSFSANTITLIGQFPSLIVMFTIWVTCHLTMKDPIPNWMFVVLAFTTQWFSLNDCMDGMRARRRKCGSPLGRMIDEGID